MHGAPPPPAPAPRPKQQHTPVCAVNDVYWPTNGIQKTPWNLWIQQAINASYNVVHAPLTKAAAAQFNVTAALAWFETVEGFDYGCVPAVRFVGWARALACTGVPCPPPVVHTRSHVSLWRVCVCVCVLIVPCS